MAMSEALASQATWAQAKASCLLFILCVSVRGLEGGFIFLFFCRGVGSRFFLWCRGLVIRRLQIRGCILIHRDGRRQLAHGRVAHFAGFQQLGHLLAAQGFKLDELVCNELQAVLVLGQAAR